MQTLTSYTQTCVIVLPSHTQQPWRWSYRERTRGGRHELYLK
jgi:hypothetical protein